MTSANSGAIPELFDSHCHLNYDYAPKTTDDLVREAQAAGVSTLMTIGTDQDSLAAVIALSEKYPKCLPYGRNPPARGGDDQASGPRAS